LGNIEIGIIGGNGAMGKWFAAFFRDNGYTVHIADKSTGMPIHELAKRCTVVIISVPIGVTGTVIAQVGPLMHEDGLLMDLTSLKAEPLKAMLQATLAEVIGLHPLFGPDTSTIEGENIVICHGRGNKWLPWLRAILEANGARIVEAAPEKHDNMMALIQGLTHLNTILMGLSLKEAGIDQAELNLFSTPAFRTKLSMIEKVFHQNPGLYSEIIIRNPGMENILTIYENKFATLKNFILNKDTEGLADLLRSDYSH
jgi:prephenate dehydrogenase